jgi:hypothetical protein
MGSEVIVVPVIFFSFVAIVKIITDSLVRRQLIKNGMVDEKAKYVFSSFDLTNGNSLKWGIVLIAIGVAFLIGNYVPEMDEEGVIGLVFVFAGLGMASYYFFSKKGPARE